MQTLQTPPSPRSSAPSSPLSCAYLQLVGFDPSFSHWGVARARYEIRTGTLEVIHLECISPQVVRTKGVRQNQKDLERCIELTACASRHVPPLFHPDFVFVETPVGSQSSRAAVSYGACLGILATMAAQGAPLVSVTASACKHVLAGHDTASKHEMIDAAVDRHPDAGWPTQKHLGEHRIVASKAEHMADAVAALHAGIRTEAFLTHLDTLHPTFSPSTPTP